MSSTTESRVAARKRRRRTLLARLLLMAALSLLLHLLLIPTAGRWLLAPPPPSKPFEVSMVPPPEPRPKPVPRPPPRPKPPEPKGRIVDVAPTKDTNVPDDARFLSEHDTHVEKESMARNRRATALPPAPQPSPAQRGRRLAEATPKPRPKPEAAKREERAKSGGQKLESDRSARIVQSERPPEAEPKPETEKATDERTKEGEKKVQLWPDSSSMRALAGGAPAPDYVPEVAEGDATWLNSRSFKYASYFNNVKRLVGPVWEPSIQNVVQARRDLWSEQAFVTVVIVTLDATGTLEDVEVTRSSGHAAIDQAALQAFRSVGRFPNPPEGLVGPDGRIHFDFGFIYTLQGSRFLWRRG